MFFALTLIKQILQSGPCCATEPFMWECKTKDLMEFAFHLTLYLTHSAFITLQLTRFTALRLQLHVLMSTFFVFNCSVAGLVVHRLRRKTHIHHRSRAPIVTAGKHLDKGGSWHWAGATLLTDSTNGCVMCCLLCTTKTQRQSRFNHSTVHTEGRLQGR